MSASQAEEAGPTPVSCFIFLLIYLWSVIGWQVALSATFVHVWKFISAICTSHLTASLDQVRVTAAQTSFNELRDDFVYLGVIESDITNSQGDNGARNTPDGIPKENFQANHPIVGPEVYQYGNDIVVGIGGKYSI